MLTTDLQSILNSIPNQVNWQDIVEFEKRTGACFDCE